MHINLLEYLERAAELYPAKPAFCGDSESFTFSELLEYSRSLGTALTKADVLRRPVAVLVGRDAESVALFMGVLQAGGFYIPVDSSLPDDRMRSMLSAVSPAAFLCREKERGRLERLFPGSHILTRGDAVPAENALLASIRSSLIDLDPAYMIFTSGSTGTPKGIVVPHRGVIDLAEWLAETFSFTDADILGNQTPFYFDASVKDIYLTLKCGLTTHILPKKLFMFQSRLIDALNEKRITSILWATSAVNLTALSGIFETNRPQYLTRVFFAGEAMTGKTLGIWQDALPGAMFVNLYGPTEATVDCSYHIVSGRYADDEPVPIGRACRNMELLLLGDDLLPVKRGEIGEICVRGTGVSLGYFGDPERSGAAFIQNPLNPHWRDIIYRTGDLARENEKGELIFAARRDEQIKRHGNRIELGDIETAARALEYVSEAVCIYDRPGDRLILAVSGGQAVPDGHAVPGEQGESAKLIRELSAKLPKYMLPDRVEYFAELPHNANGKLDRSAVTKLISERDRIE